ncbi:MAG: LapA family protein [Hyphomicrobium sp.]|nr:LapA family protein [Hyphomicrobium sp.]
MRRIFWLLIAIPVAVVLVTLAVANRHEVRLVLDPFRPDAPVVSLLLPFYGYLFVAMLIGVIVGGVAMWASQGRWRKSARLKAKEAAHWHAEADRLTRERDAQSAGAAKQLAAPGA